MEGMFFTLCYIDDHSSKKIYSPKMIVCWPVLHWSQMILPPRYYGENVLHMATTNEDPAMVKYLLDAGVNFQVSNELSNFLFSLIVLKKGRQLKWKSCPIDRFPLHFFSKWVKSSPHHSRSHVSATSSPRPTNSRAGFEKSSEMPWATSKAQCFWNNIPTIGPTSWPRRGLSSGKQQTTWYVLGWKAFLVTRELAMIIIIMIFMITRPRKPFKGA